MLRPRFQIAVMVLALLLVAPTAAVSASEPALPLLWAGQVQDQAGRQQSDVEVVAFARPPVEALEAGVPLAEVARATTNREGHFSLRTAPSADMTENADPAGWTTVMVAAFSPEGMTLALDSVAWERGREFGAANGRWVTSPAERNGRATRFMSTQQVGALTSNERPSVMVLDTDSSGVSRTRPYRRPSEVRGCALYDSKEVGRTKVPIGELHLENHWGGFFDYTNTKTTSFQIGFSRDGKPWKVAGSVSMDRARETGQGRQIPVTDGAPLLYTYKLDMIFKDLTWFCGGEYNYYFAETREPTDWTGGMRQEVGGPHPRCTNRRYSVDVIPMGVFRRSEGASVTLDGAINVGGFQAGMTSVLSSSVVHHYHNGENRHRDLCGEKEFPAKDTRIVTIE